MLANTLLARATQLTSPVVVVVGLSLSIPLAMVSDVLRHRTKLTPLLVSGSSLVWLGFIGISVATRLQRALDQRISNRSIC